MIESVYVVPAHRRKGLFSRLYAKLIEKAKAQPLVSSLILYV